MPRLGTSSFLAATLSAFGPSFAQQMAPPAYPLDAIPDKMPFSTPYGPPISLARGRGDY